MYVEKEELLGLPNRQGVFRQVHLVYAIFDDSSQSNHEIPRYGDHSYVASFKGKGFDRRSIFLTYLTQAYLGIVIPIRSTDGFRKKKF